MKKIYQFNQLPKTVLKKAAYEVYEKEMYKVQDFSHYYENIQEYIKEIITESGLAPGVVTWDTQYGLSIDFSEINMHDDYIKKVLSKEEYTLYEQLDELSSWNLEHHTFDSWHKEEGYEMVFDHSGYDEETFLEFIMEHSDDEEVKLKYKFPLLFIEDDEYELSDDDAEELNSDIISLGEKIAKKLSEKISTSLEPLVAKITKIISEHEDYIGSEEYFYDQLQAECYEAEVYRFNYQGEIVMVHDNFVDESFEEIYHKDVQAA